MNHMPSPSKSDNPRLQIIHQWLRDRLKEPTAAEGTASFLTTFVRQGLKEITEHLCVEDTSELVITVRSSFRSRNRYLRPVYSQPANLTAYFQDPGKQKPFRFPDKRKALASTTHFEPRHIKGKPYAFAGRYDICAVAGTPSTESFVGRIHTLHNALVEMNAGKNLPRGATTCFFAGRNKDDVAVPQIELQHILAIYFPKNARNEKIARTRNHLKNLLKKTEDLFDGLNLISRIDASIFEAEGLKLVAELLPEFSRDDVAPADKIAFAVEHLRHLLKRHMVGRHGGERQGKEPRLFYIATSFERVQSENRDSSKSLYPRLEIYPHVYRTNFLVASYFVTHRHIASATKFLLWRYLTSREHLLVETTSGSKDTAPDTTAPSVKCNSDFEELFLEHKLGTAPLRTWANIITPPETPDFLDLMSGIDAEGGSRRKSPWQALNKPVDSTLRSIAAFVVEGRVVDTFDQDGKKIHKRCLPRGIFAIESHYEDGFSDDDIRSLRIVFQGVAALIRLISHQNAPIDYRSLIANTFKQDAEFEDRRGKVSRLIFLVQKLDANLLRQFMSECRQCENPSETYGIDPASLAVVEEIAKICDPGRDDSNPSERSEILRTRLKKLQHLLYGDGSSKKQREQFLTDNVLSFLEACPENFTWASYLACMAQTLGDRLAGTKLPNFSRMLPGFSASGMFMAMVDGELRQVVKLSNAQDLRRENNLYRKWVRYRLVNAARIPANGLAFETIGDVGKQCGLAKETKIVLPAEGDKTSDGVLVSDLVSGGSEEEGVNTLLDLVATDVGSGSNSDKSNSEINEALIAVFVRNATLWRSAPPPADGDPTTNVLRAFRIPLQDEGRRVNFDRDIARLPSLRDQVDADLDFEKLLRLLHRNSPASIETLLPNHFRICHGDLNCRNLTWSAELRSFFLIDFERVGPNPTGTDQFRLMVNLLAELRAGCEAKGDLELKKLESGLSNLYKELDRGLNYLKQIFTLLVSGSHIPSPLKDIADQAAAERRFSSSKLVKTLKTILATVDSENQLAAAKWRSHWALMLLCSTAKEFSYSCRSVDQQQISVTDILEEMKHQKITIDSLQAVDTVVRKYVANRPGLKSSVGTVMRHFVAGRLLLGFFDANKAKNP